MRLGPGTYSVMTFPLLATERWLNYITYSIVCESLVPPNISLSDRLPNMDPLSISVSVTALISVCSQTVQLIQRTIETVKNTGKLLIKLLSQTESLRLILEQLCGLTKQLGTKAGLLLSFNDSAPRITINELNSLVKSIAEKKNFMSLQMLLSKNKVDALVERIKSHEAEVLTVLLSVATSVQKCRMGPQLLTVRKPVPQPCGQKLKSFACMKNQKLNHRS